MIITGKSGTGKTTLLRSLAQLWPFTSGTMRCPVGDNETMFLSQLPYVPLGDLRTVVSYPHRARRIPDETLRAALLAVALPRYADRLVRSGRLGQGALPRRAAAHRVRPGAADQTEGGLPRRGHLGARRTAGVHDLRPGAARTARHRVRQRHPPHARSTGTTSSISNCSARGGGGSARSKALMSLRNFSERVFG